jgi:hypothetical protein
MSDGNTPAAVALRAAGYKRVPSSWWVTQEQLNAMMEMVRESAPEVNWIRARATREAAEAAALPLTREQEIELAWQAQKGST